MEKSDIRQVVAEVLEEQREARRKIALQEHALKEQERVEHLYLISLGHHIFLPDDKGRAIGTQAIYARVKVNEDRPDFYGGTITVVAYGDGRLLDTPFSMYMTSHTVLSMVQVPESILAKLVHE